MKTTFSISTIWLLVLSFQVSIAQAPQVALVMPVGQIISAPADGAIEAMFGEPINPATVDGSNFRVFGRWSGPAKGQLSFLENNTKIRFVPDEPFFAGEWVAVQLGKSIQSATGENLAKPYAWNFWIDAAPGFLDQPLIDTIELRLPGEDYLQTYGAYAGDMNNDGYSDLVAVNESSDDLRILLNDGQGGYADFTVYDTGDDSTPSPSEGADFNNDGEIDLVVTTAWDTEVRVLTGDGQGSFTNMDTYFTSNGVRGVVAGDFNGDGWDDMLTVNRLAGNMTIFMNDGDGTFTATGMDLPGQDETACAMTDINHDGILDVFFASFNSQKAGILLGDGDGGFALSAEVSVDGRPWMIGAGDLNGDGHPDLVTVNSNSNKTAVLFGDGAGGLGQPVHYAPPNHQFPLAVDLADIDGDGDLDFVTTNYSSKNYTVFENDGTGQFSVAVVLGAVKASSCAILHDRDNDGDVDITGTDEEADVILLFENPAQPSSGTNDVVTDFGLKITPNPIGRTATVSFQMPSSGNVELSITDVSGKPIWQIKLSQVQAGENAFILKEVADLPSGLYFLIMRHQGGVAKLGFAKMD
ncbi:MAG: VCBS repeat-containing protein [Bacteroidetes bacterium]|nr:VCBS repeat-containing protein [Bacteroidota bacterium]